MSRNMKEFWFLGVGGNRSTRRKPTKAGMESANQTHIQPPVACPWGGALGAEAPRTRGPEQKKKRRQKRGKEGKKMRKRRKERKKERKPKDNEKYLSLLPPLNGFQISRHGPIRQTPQQFQVCVWGEEYPFPPQKYRAYPFLGEF